LPDLQVFCDFDGTITLEDVGNLLFSRFSDAELWWEKARQWRKNEVDGRELWRAGVSRLRISEAQLTGFVAGIELDPDFYGFYTFCRLNDIPMTVLSDGLDFYIQRILQLHGMDPPVLSNRLIEMADGSFEAEFPFFEQGCGSCANCKGSHIRRMTPSGSESLYVGDGYSDLCALEAADIVYAKDDLLRLCRERGLKCRPFSRFRQVQQGCEELLGVKQRS